MMSGNKTEKEVAKAMDMELRDAITRDRFAEKSSFSQFLYTHIPPFSSAQKEADIVDCNKSFIAAGLFNHKKLAEGVDPITFNAETFSSCKRLQK